MKLKDDLELDSTIHADQLNAGKRVEKDNTNTIPRLLVRATKWMMVPFREIRRLEESSCRKWTYSAILERLFAI